MKPRTLSVVTLLVGSLIGMVQPGAAGPSGRASQFDINPDSLDLRMDVSRLNAEEVRDYGSAIRARHCQEIEGPERDRLRKYQDESCGLTYYEEGRGKPVPPDSDFTSAERAFLDRLSRREAEIRSGQIRTGEGGAVYDPAAVMNLSQFESLSDSVRTRLFHDGFVVLPARHKQIFDVYEQNDYSVIPNFITVDPVLHMYHLYFDHALRELEETRLCAAASDLCQRMGEDLHADHDRSAGAAQADALRRAILYFAVGWMLSQPDSAAQVPAWVDPKWRTDLSRQLELVRGMTGVATGPVMATVDYTMFKPRGHYTRSETLSRYFRTMMWLGLPGFILDEKVMPLATGLYVSHALMRDREARKGYETIYGPTSFFVGTADDITPMLVNSVADSICGAGASVKEWIGREEEIRRELIRRNPARIVSRYSMSGRPDDRDLPQIRFMGMRYIPDSEILQRLVSPNIRSFPSGLDLFGVMQVPAALRASHEDTTLTPWYWSTLDTLQRQFGDFRVKETEDNLYRRWIHLLRTVNQPAPEGAALFMHTDPWTYKNLNTSLASWSQLRHDTILYAKPSGGAECGGGEIPPRVVGYVEARPDVFAELLELQRATAERLQRAGLLSSELKGDGLRLEELFTFLQDVSRKEVEGTPLDEMEFEKIRYLGSEFEDLARSFLRDPGTSYEDVFEGTNRSMATVADVHTNEHPVFGRRVLEEGVGNADEIYALVVIDGALYLTRGAVFSYYEFLQPAVDRLTDEEWQKMLGGGSAPPRPAWTREFRMREEARPLVNRYHYSSGC